MERALKEEARRQKTLLASMLVSMWAPLATGIAMFMGNSITQVADFIRRTVEFLALLLSWLVFRFLAKRGDVTGVVQAKWEKLVNQTIAVALAVSGATMFLLGLLRLRAQEPEGTVVLGLTVAVMGLAVNLWFWRRYTALSRTGKSLIIIAQRQLYSAKVVVDLCVIAALGVVAFWPTHSLTRYIDSGGSLAVAAYLLWIAFRTWSQSEVKTEPSQHQ